MESRERARSPARRRNPLALQPGDARALVLALRALPRALPSRAGARKLPTATRAREAGEARLVGLRSPRSGGRLREGSLSVVRRDPRTERAGRTESRRGVGA